MLFSEYAKIRNNIEELNENSAQIIVEKDLDPQALNELADIILEFNPLALGGALGGAAAGGIPGAIAGGYAGGKAGQGIGKWFKGGQNQQVTPALQAAKQAVGNLVNVLSAAGQARHGMNIPSQSLPKVQQSAEQLNKVLSGMDQDVSQIDKSWGQTQDSSRKSQGGIAQQTQRAGDAIAGNKKGGFRNWLGGAVKSAGNAMRGNKALSQQGGVRGAVAGMGDKMGQWAAKHPRLAGAAKLGATGAAMGAAHAMGAGGAEGGAGEMNAGGSDMATAGPDALNPQAGADVASSGADTHVDPSDQKWALPDSSEPTAAGEKWVADQQQSGGPQDYRMSDDEARSLGIDPAKAQAHIDNYQSAHQGQLDAAKEAGLSPEVAKRMSPDMLEKWLQSKGVDVPAPVGASSVGGYDGDPSDNHSNAEEWKRKMGERSAAKYPQGHPKHID